ncbi:MAG TPA: 50S ribosomal protein L4 [Candidatus Paceibacterota bacterium]|jgi:large subunit ribosomal protein L4|nr:50S ribosomal protein L4 [Candidatus Paceibacterota bacterium]
MATTKATSKKAPAKKAPAKKAVAKAAPAEKAEKKLGSMEAVIWSAAGAKSGTVTLPENLFGKKWNADLVHQVVVGMQANARPTVAHTKFRGEVSGGGKKPWKQKGTGRARHGSNRSPIWKGGGVTHGPRAEKVYAVKINKKMRLAALATVLSRKWKDGEVIFVDKIEFAAPKTSEAKNVLLALAKNTGASTLASKRKNAAVIAFASKDTIAAKSFRNIGSLMTEEVRNLNPVDLMNKKFLVIERPNESLEVLASRMAK